MIIGAKTRRIEPDITVVEISGHLNLGNNLVSIENLIKRLIAEGARKMVVDLGELSYIDSAGIGMLVGCNGQMDGTGGLLRIAGAQGSVAKVFELVHMHRIARLDPDLGAACRSFAAV
jgi:anti-sigma B factor antagonist